jgi:hypothetical protein
MVVGCLLAVGVPLAPAPATAAPGGTPVTPAPEPAEQAADPERPLTIDVGRFEPRTVTDGSTIVLAGTLTNAGGSTLSDLTMRLQRGRVLGTRAELIATDADPDPATTVTPAFVDVPGTLPPGESLAFTYELSAEDLGLTADGVYPALVNVNATDETGLVRRVGELGTWLIRRPVTADERTAVAWLWPISADTSRGPGGGFADDELAEAIAPGGRLDRALAVLEGLPSSGDGAADEETSVPVTMAVDPAVVEELTTMAAGPYAVDGVEAAGRGTEPAGAFLERLRALAAVHPVVALPYGDVDVDALAAADLSDVITRSLPGTPAGTAQDPAGPAQPGPTPAGTTGGAPADEAGGSDDGAGDGDGADPGEGGAEGDAEGGAEGDAADDPATAEDLGTTDGAGARILTEALGVRPRTDLAWAAGGSYRADAVATLADGGIARLVLGPDGLSRGQRAVGLPGGTAAAHTSVPRDGGDLDALVADDRLAALVSDAEEGTGGPRIAQQRYLAELALLGRQAADGGTPTVLIAPQREIEAGPDGAGAMIADTVGLPWLEATSVDELLATPAVGAAQLTDPADAVLLARAGLTDVAAAEVVRDELADAVVEDADEALEAYDAAMARTVSVTFRDDPAEFRATAADLRTAMGRLLERVSLLAPADGTYSLASSDAPLVLTVRNDLPFAVTVLLDLSTRGRRGITIQDIGPQVLTPGERTTLQVPTEVRQSGGFAVTAGLTTAGGIPLGDPVRLQVQSTAYGTVSLVITFGAAGLLGLLFLRRLVHFVRRRGQGAEVAGGPGGPAVGTPLPPTRSPV